MDLVACRAAELEAILRGGEVCAEDKEDHELVKMTFSLPGAPSATHYLERVPFRPPFQNAFARDHAPRGCVFKFDTQLEQGIVGPVFAGTLAREIVKHMHTTPMLDDRVVSVVAKVALHAPEAALLRHEAAMYARAESLQGGALPRVFGLFESPALRRARKSGNHGGGFTVLVIGHRGAGVKRMDALNWGQRASLYTALQALHAYGVAHGDLRADNIVVSRVGVPTLIDLSHARAHGGSSLGWVNTLRVHWTCSIPVIRSHVRLRSCRPTVVI
ncbi:hypothetical protein DFH06DRAFT_1319964 [Mycena polygramma]|nr:hypothetical protein DFH06DRAFT_1319964 [Mycena polygramma]